MNLLRKLWRTITGHRYYGVLIYDGYRDYISSNLFTSRSDAVSYSHKIRKECISLRPTGIVSFRTKKKRGREIIHNA